MSRGTTPRPSSSTEGDSWSEFSEIVEFKRKLTDVATETLHGLNSDVERSQILLAELKTNCFSLGEKIKQTEVRIRVYETRERELTEYGKGLIASVRESERKLADAFQSRVSLGKDFAQQVVQMTNAYCQFKNDCDRQNITESSQNLNSANAKLTAEIQEAMKAEGIIGRLDGEDSVDVLSPPPLDVVDGVENDQLICSLRDLQAELTKDISLADLSINGLEAKIVGLESKIVILQREVNGLKEMWNN